MRDIVASHLEVESLPQELVLFRDFEERKSIENILCSEIQAYGITADCVVNKAPANAPYIDRACSLFTEAKFLFIIRDPRDVLVSHQRGTATWMRGANSTAEGCMRKLRNYYEGYLRAKRNRNIMLLSYEQLYQDFFSTVRDIFEFIQIPSTEFILQKCFDENNFWNIATRHRERRDASRRKGVVGDWVNYLKKEELQWFQDSLWWSNFLDDYGYAWEPPTYEAIFLAMNEAGVIYVEEQELLDCRLDPDKVNVLITHDIDLLDEKRAESILEAAEIEAKFGIPGLFYFLALDDPRYRKIDSQQVVNLIQRILSIDSKNSVGLHLNAAERYFPAEMEEVGDDHPDIVKAVQYLHDQLAEYKSHDVTFRSATAHGYGRRKKLPNNRDSIIFTKELHNHGINLWDNDLRPVFEHAATHIWFYSDISGALSIHDMPVSGSITDPDTYRRCPKGSLLHFLIHPGNYEFRRKLTFGIRSNIIGTREFS